MATYSNNGHKQTAMPIATQYHATVKPMHEKYIAVSAKNADVVISWENEDLKVLEKIVKCINKL